MLTGRAVVWTSSRAAIVALGTRGGSITAAGEGSATITATVEGVSGRATVRVSAPPAVVRVRIQPDSLVLRAGTTGTLTAVAYDANGAVLTGRTAVWGTSSGAVATVQAGVVRGVAAGTAKITVTVDGVTASVNVRVWTLSASGVATVTVEPDTLIMLPGTNTTVRVIARDTAGNVVTGRYVSWQSSNSLLVMVGTGNQVMAMSPVAGTVKLTATVDGVSGYIIVIVRPPPLSELTLPLVQGGKLGGGYIDVASSSNTLRFAVHTSQAANDVKLRIRSPRGNTRISCGAAYMVSERFKNEFVCTLTLPARSEGGLW